MSRSPSATSSASSSSSSDLDIIDDPGDFELGAIIEPATATFLLASEIDTARTTAHSKAIVFHDLWEGKRVVEEINQSEGNVIRSGIWVPFALALAEEARRDAEIESAKTNLTERKKNLLLERSWKVHFGQCTCIIWDGSSEDTDVAHKENGNIILEGKEFGLLTVSSATREE